MVSISPMGDSALVLEVGDTINQGTHRRVQAVVQRLDQQSIPGVLEVVPAFTTVTVYYDPFQTPYAQMRDLVEAALQGLTDAELPLLRTVEIPVCYGGEFGPDLAEVATRNRLTPSEVIAIHTSAEYLVYMIGFAPGFPYLGGLPERIATPRRDTPRLTIPAGSVGIAGQQTGVYPLETPGGWQLIGRTPLRLFRPELDPPTLLQAGDFVRFREISREQYQVIKEETP